MPFKVTMFFSDGRYGWSETYANTLGSSSGSKLIGPNNGPLSIMPQVLQLAAARGSMLPSSPALCTFGGTGVGSIPTLQYIRISTVGVQRLTAFYDPASGEVVGGQQIANNQRLTTSTLLANESSDNPYSAIEMEMALGNGLTSKRALSGVPDITICDQSWSTNTPWYSLWKAYAAVLTNPANGWGVLSSSPVNTGGVLLNGQKILSVSQADPLGRPTITIAAPLSFATSGNGCPNYHIQIACYKSEPGGYPNLNGIYRVVVQNSTSPSGTVLLLSRSMKPLNPFDLGVVAPYAGPTFVPIIGATLTRTIGKKRGRPFGLSRGRSKVIR